MHYSYTHHFAKYSFWAKFFVAVECKVYILYNSLHTLRDLLLPRYLSHWRLFVSACWLLSRPVTKVDAERAQGNTYTHLQHLFPIFNVCFSKALLELFSQQMLVLYGNKHMTPKIHALIHISDAVLNFGPFNIFSAFPYEVHYFSSMISFYLAVYLLARVRAADLLSARMPLHALQH